VGRHNNCADCKPTHWGPCQEQYGEVYRDLHGGFAFYGSCLCHNSCSVLCASDWCFHLRCSPVRRHQWITLRLQNINAFILTWCVPCLFHQYNLSPLPVLAPQTLSSPKKRAKSASCVQLHQIVVVILLCIISRNSQLIRSVNMSAVCDSAISACPGHGRRIFLLYEALRRLE
jgi:hypothetical protein